MKDEKIHYLRKKPIPNTKRPKLHNKLVRIFCFDQGTTTEKERLSF
jgi:hypothetical protein